MEQSQVRRLDSFVVCSSLADSLSWHRHRGAKSSTADDRPAIVVGVDGLPGALKAVTWATVEAERRQVALSLVYAVDPSDCSVATDAGARDRDRSNAALEAAVKQSRSVSGSVEVVSELVHAPPSVALVRGDAVMICLGSNGDRPPHPGHRVGLTTEVLLTADCPVTVVRGEALADGWVVAQLGCDPSAADLLRVAVEESVLRRMPLRLLTHWVAPPGMPAADPAALDARLSWELDGWKSKHSGLDVAVERHTTLDQYLHDHAAQIALFIATDRQSHDIGTVLHPSAEKALRVLRCPVMLHVGARYTPAEGPGTWDLWLPKLGRSALQASRRITPRWLRQLRQTKGVLR